MLDSPLPGTETMSGRIPTPLGNLAELEMSADIHHDFFRTLTVLR